LIKKYTTAEKLHCYPFS